MSPHPPDSRSLLEDLNDRTREVFRRVVESYLQSGSPIGSRTITRDFNEKLSAATIRNVMQDLEYMGLLESPHVSAGRVPTQRGLRIFVDALLEVDPLTVTDREKLEATRFQNSGDLSTMLDHVGNALSAITKGASLVLAPKQEAPIKHIEFVPVSAEKALVVLVFANGHVENRLFTPPKGLLQSSLREAVNFVNAFASGLTLSELRGRMTAQIDQHRQEIDIIAQDLVTRGLAVWAEAAESPERLIVRGRANLLEDADSENLARIRELFDDLERKRDIVEVLDLAERGDGVRIFIGAENKLFSLTGSTLVVSPYMNADSKIIGAVGVIGPTRLNYGRVVPIVDYTAQLVGRMLGERGPD
ncbi:MAG: heat-inducible transcriptional repressor HrcA [Paracoccaceae bacterium]